MTKTELFLELAKPNKEGVSHWVNASEFVGKYKDLQLGNGGSWCRASSSLAKKYIIEFDKSKTSGNSINAVRLVGFKTAKTFNQTIRQDIKVFYKMAILFDKGSSSINIITHKSREPCISFECIADGYSKECT